jgi:hypothetical protein
MRRVFFLYSLLFAATVSAQVERNGALPGPLPLFPADNWWNADVTSAPVDPNSAAFINFIGSSRGMHPDLGGDTGDSLPDSLTYGIPFIVVPGTQPLEQVVFEYDDESDYAAPGRPPGYPIPAQTKTETKWIEGGWAGNDSNAEGDRHMLIVDRDHRILFELYALRWDNAAGRWEAGSGAIFPLDSNLRRPDTWTSADAAGLAILPGLIRYDEVYGGGPIRHAFRVTVRSTNGYVFPASHRAGSTSGALPMGARLRLKAGKDISGYPEPVRRIFQAMKTYGLIVADNGSDLYVTGTYDTRWDNDVLNPAFSSIRASDFEIVQLGWKPSEAPPCMRPVIGLQPVGGTITRNQTITLSVAVAGNTPFTYQWFVGPSGFDQAPLNGATQATLTVSPDVSTSYWARVWNPCGSDQSEAAEVTVLPGRRRPVRH